jgi:hypothetical protein
MPAELFQGHLAQTSVGVVLVLVCHELVLFSGRSIKNLRDDVGLAMRKQFAQAATCKPKPRYIVVPTHWQDVKPRSGIPFRDAASKLAMETGATVVLTMRSPKKSLGAAARLYDVHGEREGRVATLLVEDTP